MSEQKISATPEQAITASDPATGTPGNTGHASLAAAILDANPVPCFVIDSQHRVVHWNKGCEQMLGRAASAITGSDEHWQCFYPMPRPTLADLIIDGRIDEFANDLYQKSRLRRSTVIADAYEAEAFFPQLGPNGRHLFFTAAPIRDEHGRIVGAVETLQDVSSQRAAEQALRDSHENLENKIAQRTAELAEANCHLAANLDALETANRAKSSFLESISNELKTPLNGIIGIAELIRMAPNSAETTKYAALIYECGQQLNKQVNDILCLTEITSGEAHLVITPNSTRELVESVVRSHEPIARKKGIALTIHFSGNTPEIIATDGRRLSQSLAPLIENAVKYTMDGAVNIHVSHEGNQLRLSVADTGPGIPQQSQGGIFEKFRQTGNTGIHHSGGMGLGLALARAQAELLQGTLTLNTPASGRGACFILSVPDSPQGRDDLTPD